VEQHVSRGWDPTLANPTRDQWFDTTMFHVADQYTPRSNAWYLRRAQGPSVFSADMTLTRCSPSHRSTAVEARIEAYNALNGIVWQNPDQTLGSANFGKVTASSWATGAGAPDRACGSCSETGVHLVEAGLSWPR